MKCSQCGEVKNSDAFYKSASSGSWCKSCQRAYYSARVAQDPTYFLKYQNKARRAVRARVSAQKSALGCAECGERDPVCLTFHHLDPSTKMSEVRELIDRNASDERIDAEIAKTIVLCRNCHFILHWAERQAVRSA